MARSSIYHVIYHLKNAAGQRVLGPYTEFVIASAATPAAIAAVLNAHNDTDVNFSMGTGFTLEIERIANGPCPNAIS